VVWGKNTVLDRSVHPPLVSKLHYEFDGWIGDVLLESFPSFIVTEEGGRRLHKTGITGARFDEVEITTSEEFKDSSPNRRLPKFVWLRVDGQAGRDDFGTATDGKLIVSERALEVLKELGISHASVAPFGG
jgi:hypothetical protein